MKRISRDELRSRIVERIVNRFGEDFRPEALEAVELIITAKDYTDSLDLTGIEPIRHAATTVIGGRL